MSTHLLVTGYTTYLVWIEFALEYFLVWTEFKLLVMISFMTVTVVMPMDRWRIMTGWSILSIPSTSILPIRHLPHFCIWLQATKNEKRKKWDFFWPRVVFQKPAMPYNLQKWHRTTSATMTDFAHCLAKNHAKKILSNQNTCQDPVCNMVKRHCSALREERWRGSALNSKSKMGRFLGGGEQE